MSFSYDAIIVNYNGEHILSDCLQALQRSTVPPQKIIICDNGSTDNSRELLAKEFPEVQVIAERNIGFGPGNNRGTAEATAEYILYLNNDLFVAPSCAEELGKVLVAHSEAAIASPLLMRGRDAEHADGVYSFGSVINSSGFTYNVESLPEQAEEAVCFSGACFLARRAVMQQFPFEPSYFLYYEEPELAIRLFKAGWSLLRSASAVGYHLESYSSPEKHAAALSFRQYHGIQNRWFALGKHWPLRLLPQALFFNILHLLVFLLYFLRHQQWRYLALVFIAPLQFLRGSLYRFSEKSPKNPHWWQLLVPSSLGTMLGMRNRVMKEKAKAG